MDAFEQLVSVIMRMVSKPPDCGSLVMKSIVMVSKGHALSAGVMGNMGGWVGWVLTLVIWHVAYPLMYSVMKVFMLGYQ